MANKPELPGICQEEMNGAEPTQVTPTFSPVAGTYTSTQSVTIISAGADAIYYTTDGSTPTTGSTLYTAPVSITVTTTLKALAVRSGYHDSAVGTAIYTLQQATPTFSPVAGSYSGTQNVTITSSGADNIYYTTDGSTPTTGSTLYSGPVAVASSLTLKALAVKSGWSDSGIGSAAYVITGGGIAFVNSVTAAGVSSPATSGSIDTTASNLLIAVLSGYYGAPTITDSKSNTWNYLTTYSGTGSGGENFVRIAYCFNPITDAAHTFTIAQASGYVAAVISTYSGADTTSAVFEAGTDSGNHAAAGAGITLAPGSVTPLNTGDLVISGLSTYAGSSISVDSSLSEIDTPYTGQQSASLGYLITTGTSPVNPTWTYTSGYTAGGCIAVFKKNVPAIVAPRVRQSFGKNASANSNSQPTFVFPVPCAAGSAVYILLQLHNTNSDTVSITDDQSNTYVLISGPDSSAEGTPSSLHWLFGCDSVSGTPQTITFSQSNSSVGLMAGVEITGATGVDTNHYKTVSASQLWQDTGGITTSAAHDLLVAFACQMSGQGSHVMRLGGLIQNATGFPNFSTGITLVLSSVANAVGSNTVYTGTITGGGSGAYIDVPFVISGFSNPANNGVFVCQNSDGTTLTLINAGGTAETASASAAAPWNDLFWGHENVSVGCGIQASCLDAPTAGAYDVNVGVDGSIVGAIETVALLGDTEQSTPYDVAHTAKYDGTGSASTTTLAIDTTGATLLVVCANTFSGPSGQSVTDSKGNTWHALTLYNTSATGSAQIFYAYDQSGSPLSVGAGHTFTYNCGAGGGALDITVVAFKNTQTGSDPFQSENGSAGSGGVSSRATGNVTPASAGDLVFSAWSISGNDNMIPDSGFAPGPNAAFNFRSNGCGFIDALSTSAISVTWTLVSGGTNSLAVAVAVFSKA